MSGRMNYRGTQLRQHVQRDGKLPLDFSLVSPDEILAASKGGLGKEWSNQTLREWGIPIPAPMGWRRLLERRWFAAVAKRLVTRKKP
jgi:hypothetical protein